LEKILIRSYKLKVQEIHKQFIRASRRLILRKMASLGCKKNLLNNLKSVLIVAPHPDDEVLGCGGLLAECTDNGIRTDILFLTNGEASHKGCCVIPEKDVATMRRSQAVSSSKILSIPHERLHFLGSRDGSCHARIRMVLSHYLKRLPHGLRKQHLRRFSVQILLRNGGITLLPRN
jgi:hypothetical protein